MPITQRQDLTPREAEERGVVADRGENVALVGPDLSGPEPEAPPELVAAVAAVARKLRAATPSPLQIFFADPNPAANEHTFTTARVPLAATWRVAAIAVHATVAGSVQVFLDTAASEHLVATWVFGVDGDVRPFPALWLSEGQRLAIVVSGSSGSLMRVGVTGTQHS